MNKPISTQTRCKYCGAEIKHRYKNPKTCGADMCVRLYKAEYQKKYLDERPEIRKQRAEKQRHKYHTDEAYRKAVNEGNRLQKRKNAIVKMTAGEQPFKHFKFR